jgi:hypothetical protein
MSEEMSDEVRIGAAHRGGHEDGTHGIQALHGMTPLDEVIAMEEAGRSEREEVRVEAMRRFMLYLFADERPGKVWFATRRLFAVARGFYPQLLLGMSAEELQPVFAGENGECGVNRRESLAGILEGDLVDVRDETVGLVMGFLFTVRGRGGVKVVMQRLYCLAKAFFPETIKGMSLERLGEVFGEPGRRGARARWSARVKKVVSEFIEAAGGVGHLKYQKSESTCRKYAAAQAGNQNRRKKN